MLEHPLDDYKDIMDANTDVRTADFALDESGETIVKDGQYVTAGGIISKVLAKSAKNGQPMAFVTLEDLVGSVEVIVFPKNYAESRPLVYEGSRILVRGRVSTGSEEDAKLIAESMISMDSVKRQVWIKFRNFAAYKAEEKYITSLSEHSEIRGEAGIVIYLGEERQRKNMPASCNIRAEKDVIDILKRRYGDSNVAVTYQKMY